MIVLYTFSLIRKFFLLESPKIQHFQFPDMVKIAEKINIPCMVSRGNPPFKFEWHKNGEVLKSKNNIEVVENNDISRLIINPVNEKSSGNYTCTVRNEHGYDSLSTVLNVKGK